MFGAAALPELLDEGLAVIREQAAGIDDGLPLADRIAAVTKALHALSRPDRVARATQMVETLMPTLDRFAKLPVAAIEGGLELLERVARPEMHGPRWSARPPAIARAGPRRAAERSEDPRAALGRGRSDRPRGRRATSQARPVRPPPRASRSEGPGDARIRRRRRRPPGRGPRLREDARDQAVAPAPIRQVTPPRRCAITPRRRTPTAADRTRPPGVRSRYRPAGRGRARAR